MSPGSSPTEATPGISVLMPVFNRNVIPLSESILSQLTFFNDSELRIYDDGSIDRALEKSNREVLDGLSKVVYKPLNQNLGRTRIRNLLCEEAKYQFLIFIDCDSQLIDKDWINNYWSARANPVIYGGTMYETYPPNSGLLLHWKIGSSRETRAAKVRKQQPYRFFSWNNVAIQKSILLNNPIPAIIQGYGHEDSLFASVLEREKIPITHIDNPVIHLGLEPNEVFLQKGQIAVDNLIILSDKGFPQYQHQLFRKWYYLYHLLLKWIPLSILKLKLYFIKKILLSPFASPVWYDFYKLFHLELAYRKYQKRN